MNLSDINSHLKNASNKGPSWDSEAKQQIEQSSLVKSILNLSRIIPDKSQVYSVVCYVLTEEVSPDGSHGVLFIEGTYPREDMAKKRAQELVNETGIPNCYVVPTCKVLTLNTKAPTRKHKVTYLENGHLLSEAEKLDRQRKKKQLQELEDAKRIQQLTEKAKIDSNKSGTIEEYRKCWENYFALKMMQKSLFIQIRQNKELLKQASSKLVTSAEKNPEHEDNWLEDTKKILSKLNKSDLFPRFEKDWKKHRKTIFPEKYSTPSSSSDSAHCEHGICLVPPESSV